VMADPTSQLDFFSKVVFHIFNSYDFQNASPQQ